MSDFKTNKREFIECCRIYKGELAEYESLKNKKLTSKIEISGLQYLKEDIDYVDNMFQKLKRAYGTASAVILWHLYIQGWTRKEIALRYKLNKDQLREDIGKWEQYLFG